MATSGVYTWEMTRDQIITDALRKVGAIDEESTPTAAQLTLGARALNGVIKTLAGSVGMPLWAIDETSITLTATPTYTIGIGQTVNVAKPIKIIQAWRYDSTIPGGPEIRVISQHDYNRLPNKAITGTPIQIAYEPGLTSGVVSVYPTPDSYSITNTVIKIRYHRQFQDFSAAGDTPDFPVEWHLPVTFHLALAISPDYGVPKQDKQDLKSLADMYTEMAQQASYEDAPFNIQPDLGPRK